MSTPTPKAVLVGRGPILVFVFRSEGDEIEANIGVRLYLTYLATFPRLRSPPTFFAHRRNVLLISSGAGEPPLVVRTALAQLRCVPYC